MRWPAPAPARRKTPFHLWLRCVYFIARVLRLRRARLRQLSSPSSRCFGPGCAESAHGAASQPPQHRVGVQAPPGFRGRRLPRSSLVAWSYHRPRKKQRSPRPWSRLGWQCAALADAPAPLCAWRRSPRALVSLRSTPTRLLTRRHSPRRALPARPRQALRASKATHKKRSRPSTEKNETTGISNSSPSQLAANPPLKRVVFSPAKAGPGNRPAGPRDRKAPSRDLEA